jgi:predicted nuclease with RNAse H fold
MSRMAEAGPVHTLGVDLASREETTAACLLRWHADAVEIAELCPGVSDATIVSLAGGADAVGIDAPFGWPFGFVEFVRRHHGGEPWPVAWSYAENMRALRLRRTDLEVRARLGRDPLSVSSDRIALPAMRCAGLLHRLGVGDRSGRDGHVYEVYPALALKLWVGRSSGYKQSGNASKRLAAREQRAEILARLRSKAPWLPMREECIESDHVLDALVAALIARAAHLGLVEPIPEDAQELARTEGWIAIPAEDALNRLCRA